MKNNNLIQEEQISVKDLFGKLVSGGKVISNNWRLLLIGVSLSILYSFASDWANYHEPQYSGSLVFNLELGGGQQGGGELAALLGGVSQVTVTGGDLLGGGNFASLIQSKAVYERALMRDVIVGEKKMLFINYYKDSSDIARKTWGGNFYTKPNQAAIDYRFTKKEPKDFTREENVLIQTIYEKLTKETAIIPQKGSSLTTIQAITNNEMLSKIWIETLMEATEDFYKEMKTSKTRVTLRFHEKRLDSLKNLLYSSDSRLAQMTFNNTNVVDPMGPLRQQQISRYNGMYAGQYQQQLNIIDNLKSTLMNQTPIFTVVEPIRLPLIEFKVSIGENIGISTLIGLVISILFIFIRHFIRELTA